MNLIRAAGIVAAGLAAADATAQDRGMAIRSALEDPAQPLPTPHALVIGIDRYEKWGDLQRAREDATALAALLREQYGFEDVRLLLDGEATRRGIVEALRGLLDLDEPNSVLIYYAGHGHWDEKLKEGYWVPADASMGTVADYIPNSTLLQYVGRMKARHVTIVSDSCFSGTLLKRGAGDALPALPDAAWYRKMAARASRYAITSGDIETVPDRSVFSTKLLNALRYAESPVLSVQELALTLQKEVARFAPGQTVLEGRVNDPVDAGGQFVFVRRTGTARTQAETGRESTRRPSSVSVATPAPAEPKPGDETTVDLRGGVSLGLCWIPAGEFTMGSEGEYGQEDNEKPRHRVTISRGFWMGKYEVTQRQYLQVMGDYPSGFAIAGPDAPMSCVTWTNAKEFCERLQGRLPADLRGCTARLPTEAEWEYACRAGTWSALYTGKGLTALNDRCSNLDRIAWYHHNSDKTVHLVGAKRPNAWGLYDMLGNVSEWCWDGERRYTSAAQRDPVGAGPERVLRGGGYFEVARMLRCAARCGFEPSYASSLTGFRVVVSPRP